MFEKEAEEIANKKLCSKMMCYNHCNFNSPKHHRCGEWHRCYESAKDGAEFGYNKANEWHYVKDGDLPKHEVNVLVLFNKQCIDIAHYNYDYKEWHFVDSIVRDVIAWKEIIPPKESE